MRIRSFMWALACVLLVSGCAQVQLFPDYGSPLQEFTLEGQGADKVLMVPIRGVITAGPEGGTFRDSPGLLQETVAQLDKAARDGGVKAVVLAIDSPGGTATGSDALYSEIVRYKKNSGAKVVACQMEVAASGGYFASLAADRIVAHETTVTGSVGTIFMRPKVDGLFDKIGVDVEVTKSGELKDMGSPFRDTTSEEQLIFWKMVSNLNSRFLKVVTDNRDLTGEQLEEIATARIYTGAQAQEAGLVDELGGMRAALASAKKLAGLPKNARVVAYRRKAYAEDNIYNPFLIQSGPTPAPLIDLGPMTKLMSRPAGFYYLWLPEAE